ncbi:MAG: hypothetical protein AVDCRST_MAG88-4148 [uncultured Thermomicrobiales bacterium]|uniref:Uncharacterized protein n=1 Tax=uncultured Thermomicrobiales bacterium TaxID=1645740 RepID=A0A6J4VTE8_9BACT|nr:MAG: hypothetical protein AVDCRST_MAG88-4148 [uncultured Thermomicrobiales bacterium]
MTTRGIRPLAPAWSVPPTPAGGGEGRGRRGARLAKAQRRLRSDV